MKNQKQPTPETYIKTRVRNLPLGNCYINEGWKEGGMATVIVTRKHTTGNFTVGIYLVDLFALGTKNTAFRFNLSIEQLKDLILETSGENLTYQIEYPLAHNIVYGGNEFAEENGFKIHKDFKLTQYILEEDTDDIPLVDIEFGRDGKVLLM